MPCGLPVGTSQYGVANRAYLYRPMVLKVCKVRPASLNRFRVIAVGKQAKVAAGVVRWVGHQPNMDQHARCNEASVCVAADVKRGGVNIAR